MRLPDVVTGLVGLACALPALAVLLAVALWEDRTHLAVAGAVVLLLVSVPVAVVLARRFYRPLERQGPVEV